MAVDTIYYIMQGVWGFFKACGSITGIWVPTTVVAAKTNTNSIFIIICFTIMFMFLSYILVQICRIFANSFIETLMKILSQNLPTSKIILAAFSLLMLLVKFGLIIFVLLRLMKSLATGSLYIAAHTVGIGQYLGDIVGTNRRTIGK
jgi:hypothetical protein